MSSEDGIVHYFHLADDGTIEIHSCFYAGGIMGDGWSTVSKGERFVGIPYAVLAEVGAGQIVYDPHQERWGIAVEEAVADPDRPSDQMELFPEMEAIAPSVAVDPLSAARFLAAHDRLEEKDGRDDGLPEPPAR